MVDIQTTLHHYLPCGGSFKGVRYIDCCKKSKSCKGMTSSC